MPRGATEKLPHRLAFTLNGPLILVATYNLISGYASCPSLYTWNGTGYSYVTDVSNAGWLGYIGYMTSSGTIVNIGGNPWDNVKLNPNLMAIKNIDGNNYYDMTLFQQADELFYLDAAYLLVVDHPAGTQVYSSVTNYLNPGMNDQIYTVNQTSITSQSAQLMFGDQAAPTRKAKTFCLKFQSLTEFSRPATVGFLVRHGTISTLTS